MSFSYYVNSFLNVTSGNDWRDMINIGNERFPRVRTPSITMKGSKTRIFLMFNSTSTKPGKQFTYDIYNNSKIYVLSN